jgi:transcriptional regulator of acetoin/glycerol metabolism
MSGINPHRAGPRRPGQGVSGPNSDEFKHDASRCGRNGLNAQRAALRYTIEGTAYTIGELAAALGISQTTAQKRLRREQQRPGIVTLAALRGTA